METETDPSFTTTPIPVIHPSTSQRLNGGDSGSRAFSVSVPAAWNSLPSDIRTASTLFAFKNRL